MIKLVLLTLIIINIFLLIYFIIKSNKIIDKLKEEKIKQYEKDFKDIDKQYKKKVEQLENEVQNKKKLYNEIIQQNEEIINKEEEKKNLILNQKIEIINKELEQYKEQQIHKIEKDNNNLYEAFKLNFENQIQQIVEEYLQYEQISIEEKEKLDATLNEIKENIKDYRKRQYIINETIRKEEELKNHIDYHRIILSNSAKEDIYFLLSIKEKIHNKELLYKLIWSEYIQKAFNEMINNLFGSKIPKNVIYCIENINTHKKYIGKTSAEVSKRWTEHIKSSLNIGSIKSQKIHEALFNHWDEYTFSILEETTKEQLSEKEKYYIDFFETDKYGYNMKRGG